MNEIRQTTLNRTQPPSKLIPKPVINNSKATPARPSKNESNSLLKQPNNETKLPSLNRSSTYIVDSPNNETLSNSQVQIDVQSMEKSKTKSSPNKTASSMTKQSSVSTDMSNSAKKSNNSASGNNSNLEQSETSQNSKASRPSLAQLKQKKREELLKTKTSSQLEATRPESALSRDVENILKSSHRTGFLNLSNLELEEVPLSVWRFNIDKGNLNASESDALSMERNDEELKWWDHVDLTKLILASNKIRLITKEIKYLNTLINLDLHDNKIEMIDEAIGELISLQTLNISHNQILTLPNNICLLRYVTSLNASNNMLKQLPKNFGYLDDLDDLDLSHNSIENIPKSFAWLIKLRKLNLCANSLNKLIPELFFSQSLVIVDLSENQIEELPKEIGDLENLEQLFLRQNRLTKLPILTKCCKLKDWDVSFNKLEEINDDCFTHLISLVNFNLRDNQLSQIPQTIKLLQSLERLDLSNNNLTNLPFELASIESLKQILLNGNPLRAIRKDIINRGTDAIMKHLRNHYNDPMSNSEESKENIYKSELIKSTKVFDLSCRKLTQITTDMVSYCKHSTALVFNLSKNCLSDLPNNMDILNDQLSELNLGFNSFKTLPKSIFDLKCLTTLDLRNNQLTTLPIEIGKLDTLRELILSNNRLTEIPIGVYSLSNLENFFANNNKICSIQAIEIVQMKHLSTLNLQNNDISQVPPELGKATQLKSLQLEGNPFRLPRPNILAKGTAAILDYLRGRLLEQ